jgi:dihydrofolate reductase
MIRAIFACDEDWGIGKDGTLPWPHQAEDQKWFANMTRGDTVVMGRITWEDPDMPKPLPKRENIVISAQEVSTGYDKKLTLEEALLELPKMNFEKEIWVIGGSQMLELLLDIVDEIHLSRIKGKYECDTFLPRSLIEENFTLTDSGPQGENLYIDVWSKR